MARCLLVSYAGYPVMASSLFPDNGLASLAGTLIHAGHQVKILDFNTVSSLREMIPPQRTEQLGRLLPVLASGPSTSETKQLVELNGQVEQDLNRFVDGVAQRIADEVERDAIQMVGFKLWSGDGFVGSVRMARHLRRCFPELLIAGGGPAVLYSGAAIFDITDVFDVLVEGEGEEAVLGLARLCDGAGQLCDLPNALVRRDDGVHRSSRQRPVDLAALPAPCYLPAVYPSLSGDDQIRLFVLDESRGCPMGCAFCIHQDASGNRWRTKSADRLLREIRLIQRDHPGAAFRFGGSYTPAKVYDRFARLCVEQEKNYLFCGFGHPGGLPEENMGRLAEAGCQSLFLGVESFDPDDLKQLGKRLNPQRARRSIRRCIEAGIVPVISLIVPVPGQTPDRLEVNRRAVLEFCVDEQAVLVTQFPGLLPGTVWWSRRADHGIALDVSEAAYRKLLATYKIRHIIPPSMWAPLAYSVDGKPFAGYAAENAAFQRDMATAKVVVNVPDEVVLLSRTLDQTLVETKQQLQKMMFSLDAGALTKFTRKVNQAFGERA